MFPLPTIQPVRCRNPLCRRWLHDPESVARGYGLACAQERGLMPPRWPRLPVVRGVAANQQDLLNLINTREIHMTVKTFRKRPIVIQAVQWTGDNEDELRQFTDGKFQAIATEDRIDDIEVTGEVFDTLHSTWVAMRTGDWVLRGVQGEFYPCRDDVLAETYEPVDA